MDDKEFMQNELLNIKEVCDLYMHGAIESSTLEVHEAFKNALNISLDIQNKIYNLMAEKGWYSMQNVEQEKINALKDKFSQN